MDTILVAKVDRYSPDSECAEITLRSNETEIVAFSWPCNYKVGDRIPNHLHTLDGTSQAAYFIDWPEGEKQALSIEYIERIGTYQYRGRGRVMDQENGLIQVCGFIIELCDVQFDEMVDFEISRLDLE
jgi:hypothetical protein